MKTRRLDPTAIVVSLGLLAAVPSSAVDWPQYRGPQGDGRSADEGLLTSWLDTRPREVWRRPIGDGFSAVSVVDGRAYTMEAVGLEEAVVAIDSATGETIWRTVVGQTEAFFPSGGPRTTPTLAEGVVYTVSSRSRLLALSADSGEIQWEKDLLSYGPVPRYGYSASPLVDGDQILVLVGDRKKQPGAIALDRSNGELLWEALDGPTGYASPIVAEIGGVRQYIFSSFLAVLGLSTDGQLLWSHETGPKTALPMPVFVAPDRVFVATADDQFGGLMVRIGRSEEGFHTEEVWKERLMRNHFNTSVLVDGYLYGFDNATFRCLDAVSGEKRWGKRGFGKGSLIAAGDLLYVLSDDGLLALVQASPEGYREAGRLQVMEGRSWTAPTLADGHLYVRDFDELVRLDVRGSSAGNVEPATRSLAMAQFGPDGLRLEQIIDRHVEARGGRAAWSAIEALAFAGIYAAFSEQSPFTMVRRRGDSYRLDFQLLGGDAIRARDPEGYSWWQHALLQAEPARIVEGVYKPLLERESLFGPLLLDYAEKGLKVGLAGIGVIDDRVTIDLRVTFPGGEEEIWHLDPQTYLEVAVDSRVHDHTQGQAPLDQRAFYSDFRQVGGVVVPFRVDLEFGARLEEMRVESVAVNPDIDLDSLKAPPPPPQEEEREPEAESR